MGRKGRKLRVNEDKLKKIFIKYSTDCINTKIKYNDPIFHTISEEINHDMSPLALYSWLKRNYNKVFDISTTTESSLSSPSCRSTTSSTTKSEINDKHTNQFSFLLDEHEWKKVEPISVRYIRRDLKTTSTHKKYKTLPKFKWSNLLKEKIWQYSRRPCTWTFKNKLIDSEDNVKIKGKCTQCSCTVEICSEKLTDKTATIKCTIFNTDNLVPHNPKLKSKMSPYKRNQLAKKLQYKSATVIHKEIASKVIKYKDNAIPPILPTMNALRKIKHEKRQSNRLHANPILSLLMMSMLPSFKNLIREIKLVPNFYMYYWSEEQNQFYKDFLEKNPQEVTITIDATGSFFHPIKLPDGSTLTKRLFLYVCMLTSKTIKSQAIFQMIADTHTADSISSWLKRWYKEIHTAPNEVVTDDSSALIAANVDAFTTSITVKNYLRQSFLVLRKLSVNLPEVFLRLDTSHFIKNVYNLPCFQNVDTPIKMFFIRCILLIKRSESFDEVKMIVSNMVKICTYKYYNTTNKAWDLAMQNMKERLFATEDPVPEYGGERETFYHDTLIIEEDNIMYWFDEIVEQQKSLFQTPTETRNKYYLPHLTSTLRRLLIKLPLWSNVMCPLYDTQNKSPTSSSVESYFKTLKHLLFETRTHKYNIDEFLNIHYNFLQGETKVSLKSLNDIPHNISSKSRKRKLKRVKSISIKKRIKNAAVTFTSDSIFAEEPSYTENWKGEGYETHKITSTSILFLKNGNVIESKQNVLNTCAFDSVFFMLAHGYQTNNYIREVFNSCENSLIRDFINILAQNQNEKEAYKLRENIVSLYYQKKNNYYECNCNMAFVFEHILFDFLFSAERSKKCITPFCNEKNVTRFIVFLSLNFDIINMFGIRSLEDAIVIDNLELKHCLECNNKSIKYEYKLNNIILFDLNGTQNIILNEIPRYIKITERKTFKLIGALEYVLPCVGNIGHYKCHCLIDDQWLCYDDNRNKTHESSVQPITLHNLTYGLIGS